MVGNLLYEQQANLGAQVVGRREYSICSEQSNYRFYMRRKLKESSDMRR